ncbi:hypothetical protein L195_g001711 [Trifolium pratense]|uniref:Uncharacterized protein n=1 Tax=Trifolium pratense TaxID=57577 RepID=A0A2K3NQH7_TRIPR|nr:hypothetical protein L195_g001711 [Trifolium pratense]
MPMNLEFKCLKEMVGICSRVGFGHDGRQDEDARKKYSSSTDEDTNVHAIPHRTSKENISVTNRPSDRIEDRHHLLNPHSQEVKNQKVREIKDQILMAKVYLKFAPPGSNSRLKELELQMKEMERAVEGATRDLDLSRR